MDDRFPSASCTLSQLASIHRALDALFPYTRPLRAKRRCGGPGGRVATLLFCSFSRHASLRSASRQVVLSSF